jgi:hypothetical protein
MRGRGVEHVGEQPALGVLVVVVPDDVFGPRRLVVARVNLVLRADVAVARLCGRVAWDWVARMHDAVVVAAPLVLDVRDCCVVADARSAEGSLFAGGESAMRKGASGGEIQGQR